jgi:segregation and condensation protein B
MNETPSLSHSLEALLFAGAQTMTTKELSTTLGVSIEDIEQGLTELAESLSASALMLARNGDDVSLVTRPEHSALLEKIRKEELSKDLSKAAAETLAIIAYYPGVSKAQIEFIRGVNATYSIRALAMRGLVESKGKGGYHPTTELLQHYGVASLTELPQYSEQYEKIKKLLEGAVEIA